MTATTNAPPATDRKYISGPTVTTVVRSRDQYARFLDFANSESILVLDLETGDLGKYIRESTRVLCASFYGLTSDEVFILPISKREGARGIPRFGGVTPAKKFEDIGRIFADPAREWVGQRIQFDVGYLDLVADIRPAGRVWDTIYLESILDAEAQRRDLESLVERYLGEKVFKGPMAAWLAAWRARLDVENFKEVLAALRRDAVASEGIFDEEVAYLDALIAAVSGGVVKTLSPAQLKRLGTPHKILGEVAAEGSTRRFEIETPFDGVGGLAAVALNLLPEDLRPRVIAGDKCFETTPGQLLYEYAGRDAHRTGLVFMKQLEELIKDPAAEALINETHPIPIIMAALENTGVRFDREYAITNLTAPETGVEARIATAEATVRAIAYKVTDWSREYCSVMDLGKRGAFAEIVMRAGVVLKDRTESGASWKFDDEIRTEILADLKDEAARIEKRAKGRAEDEAALTAVKLRCELVEAIDTYTYLTGKRSKFYAKFIPETEKHPRVHSSFHPGGARTARLSSSDPPLQNIDKKEPDCRNCFRAEPGHILVEFDQKQFEPRITARSSGDPRMSSVFLNNLDFYTETAKWIYEVEKVAKALRSETKTVVLAKNYNATAAQIARKMRKPRAYVEDKMRKYDEAYHVAAAARDDRIEMARRDRFVTNAFGRKRDLSRYYERALRGGGAEARSLLKHLDNTAANSYVQSTAADIALRQYVRIHNWLEETGLRREGLVLFLFPVHDSVMFSCAIEVLPILARAVVEILEAPYVPGWEDFPFPSECKIGERWGSMFEIGDGVDAIELFESADVAEILAAGRG